MIRQRLVRGASVGRTGSPKVVTLAVTLIVLATTVTSLATSVAPAGATTNPGDINTVAGTVLPGPSQAVQTGQTPVAVAVDGAGAFAYVADITYNVVRRYDINTFQEQVVAGTGVSGLAGDGGPATSAQLNGPSGVAVDGLGNLFIVDRGNNRVRKVVLSSGIISTIVGTGTAGFNGDGAGTAVQLNDPVGIVVDPSNNVIISDRANNRVRRWTASNSQLATVAGNGTAGYSGDGSAATTAQINSPSALTIDGVNNIYVSDYGNNRIRAFTVGGTMSTFAGSGVYGYRAQDEGVAATSAQLSLPQGLAVSGTDVLISDSFASRIRKVTVGGVITTVAGTTNAGFSGDGGPATSAQLRSPWAIAVNAGNVYVPDFLNNRVRRFTVGGNINTIAGTSGDGPAPGGPGTFAEPSTATATQVNFPGAVATSGTDLYVADTASCRVRKISGGNIATVAGSTCGNGAQKLDSPAGVAVTAGGDVYIADTGNCVIKKLTGGTGSMSVFAGNNTCGYGGDGSSAGAAQLNRPSGLAVTATDLYIADRDNAVVRKVTLSSPTITTVAGTPGTPGLVGDGGAATSAQLSAPSAVEVSGTDLYIADRGNCRVRKVTGGTISTFAGTTCGFGGDGGAATSAQLANPSDVAIDSLGIVYIADTGNNRVRKVVSGTISTRVGTGTAGFSGDGGQAGLAKVSGPQSVAVDASRNLYLADTSNSRIRRVEAPQVPGAPTAVAATAGQGSGVVTWAAPANDGGSPILGYTATSSPGGQTCTAPAGTLTCEVFGLTAGQPYTFTVTASNDVGPSSASAASNQVTPLGPFGFHAIQPNRVLDSRFGVGLSGQWGAGQTRALQVTGTTGVPATGVSAIVMNVTVTEASTGGFLTVFPGDVPQVPLASNLNFAAGETAPNLVTVRVPTSGPSAGVVQFYNNAGAVSVIADVVGWFDDASTVGDRYTSLQPSRILDSRVGVGASGPWGANTTRTVQVTGGTSGVPADASAVVMNVTVAETNSVSFLTVYPSGTTRPTASNLNWAPGVVRPNLVTVKLGTGGGAGKVDIFNFSGNTSVIADVVGYYSPSAGDGLHAISPSRVLDSRFGVGGYNTPWGPGTSRNVQVAGLGSVPALAKAVVVNVTATQPSATSFLTAYPAGSGSPPNASNLNWVVGQTIPNLVIVKVGPGGAVSLFNYTGTVHVIADVVGWYG